jgi:large subunit ribosomal protein L21e
MVRATLGFRRSTRRKLKKTLRHKFKVTPYLTEFKVNDRVTLKPNPSSHKGMPFPKFKGKTGVVKEKRGDAYIVEIRVGNRLKEVISRPEHLVLKK